MEKVLNEKMVEGLDRYFRTVNYLAACQLYLLDNPLLKRKLEMSDIKKKIVGHWGTVPGQNFIYTHLNRIIKKYDLDMFYVSGPGHGGNAMVANTYVEGSYSEVYPHITEDEEGLKKLFKQFSFPCGISSHVAPETPGSIHEGGELGYSLAHSFGAVLDNPNLIVACTVGDGEAETGPLATSWQGIKFINPKTDGTVLPILHLNGYKIANPTIFSRMTNEEITNFFDGSGYEAFFVEGFDTKEMHEKMAFVLDRAIEKILRIKKEALEKDVIDVKWPVIILRTPKGWTGPKEVSGNIIEGSFRAHKVPIVIDESHPENLELLENWLRSYRPEELFDDEGHILDDIKQLVPEGDRRMGLNPHTNGGKLLEELRLPDFRNYKVDVTARGTIETGDMTELGKYVRDIIRLNEDKKNYRVFAPDEALSNRLNHMFEATTRKWNDDTYETDEFLASTGRVIDSYLSEHMCEGMLEGYLLTGRHGFFTSYEAFIRVVDSMASQHAKWLKVTKELPWRRSISSLNYVLTSHCWQQDHNGYTHQDPGFLNHIVTKKADTVRIYLPADANCLLSCFEHCTSSKNYINVLVASKHPRPQWLTMDEAIKHCAQGLGIWSWISNDEYAEPDIVMACAGDTPTLEVIAAVCILRKNFKELKIRVVNVVDLMRLESNDRHPHGLTDEDYNAIFTTDKPIIFAFHGYPSLVHQLTYKRENKNLHVHGYIEEGTITTPFDMRVQNKLDRYNLVIDALKYLPNLGNRASKLIQECKDKLVEHKEHIKKYGVDMDEIVNFSFEEERKNF